MGEEENYNNKNNLALSLFKAARYSESLVLLKENIDSGIPRYESLACWVDVMNSFLVNASIPQTQSQVLFSFEYLDKSTKYDLSELQLMRIHNSLRQVFGLAELLEIELTPANVELNNMSEKEEFEQMDEYRKFVLNNNLSLNEHSIYCLCSISELDNLRIGLQSGSEHHSATNLNHLDAYCNRIVSEYTFARLLFYRYMNEQDVYPDDVTFSPLSKDSDIVGYRAESIRTCFRLLYGVLDKIANGILDYYQIEKSNNGKVFEQFIGKIKEELSSKDNIHLMAIYSISLDLIQNEVSKSVGGLHKFKKTRNRLEHELLYISERDTDLENNEMYIGEFKIMTLNLMQLTRSAIFSFVHFLRTETIDIES